MKKILVGTVLVIILIGMANVVAGDVIMPGEQQPNECCVVRHNLKPLAGDTNGPSKGDIAGPDFSSFCDIGTVNYTSASWAAYCSIDAIYTITDWAFWIVMILAVLIFVIAGGMFVTAAGDPEKAARGKKIIIYGVVGVIIALLAKLIPAVARFFLGL